MKPSTCSSRPCAATNGNHNMISQHDIDAFLECEEKDTPMNAITRTGDFMLTASGHAFWPLDPRPEEIHIADIAHALSHMCRYAGHCREPYSVAQHSVLVSRALPREFALWGLLHDASEAYVVDVPRPLKPFLQGYEDIEKRVMAAVVKCFGLVPSTIPPEVKRVDKAILRDEMRDLMHTSPHVLDLPEPALGIEIAPWTQPTAKRIFLQEYARLTR